MFHTLLLVIWVWSEMPAISSGKQDKYIFCVCIIQWESYSVLTLKYGGKCNFCLMFNVEVAIHIYMSPGSPSVRMSWKWQRFRRNISTLWSQQVTCPIKEGKGLLFIPQKSFPWQSWFGLLLLFLYLSAWKRNVSLTSKSIAFSSYLIGKILISLIVVGISMMVTLTM